MALSPVTGELARRRQFRLLLLAALSALSLLPASAVQAAPLKSRPAGRLGYSVALTRVAGTKLAIVGAPGVNRCAGAVYVYAQRGSAWRRQATITAPANTPSSCFGSAVAASGSTVVIGNRPGGKVYVYQRSGTSWRLQAALLSPDGSPDYGSSVAVSGAAIVVGDPALSPKVYIYHLDQAVWSQQAVLASPRPGNNHFGVAVAVSGSTAMIGGLNRAYVYVSSGSTWTEQASLRAFGQYFGEALSISGSTAVVGAWGAYHYAGRAYIFQRAGQTWSQVATLRDPARNTPGAFGSAVAISGQRVVVGAPAPFRVTTLCGTTYEFTPSAGRWSYRAEQADPGCRRLDQFGYALGLLNRTALIGAPGTNHSTGAAYEVTVP